MLRRIVGYLISFFVIMSCLLIGLTIQHILDLAIPGSIFGMLLLFILLALGLIPPEWVRPTSQLFIRYMVLLFIPISVGLMNHFDMLVDNALPILASTIGGTTIVIVLLGLGLEKQLKDPK